MLHIYSFILRLKVDDYKKYLGVGANSIVLSFHEINMQNDFHIKSTSNNLINIVKCTSQRIFTFILRLIPHNYKYVFILCFINKFCLSILYVYVFF